MGHKGYKRPVSEEMQIEKMKLYIEDIKSQPWCKDVYREMGVNFETFPKGKLVKRLMRKARYLITTPKFKDEDGNLCPQLEIVSGDIAKEIVKWLSMRNRRSTLKALDEKKNTGWLNNSRLSVDGRLPARAAGLANTTRQRHSIVVNVPKADPKVLLGKEFRSLFYAPQGKVFLGFDASALEQRVACLWCWEHDDGWYYQDSMCGEDYHEKMAVVYRQYAPKVTRGSGKGVSYGILYGCQAAKLAAMLGISKEAAQLIIDGFWETNWSLKLVKDNLEAYWEGTGKRYIRSIDGRKIYTRSKHSLLNCLFQSTGAVIMDLTGSIMRKQIRDEGLQDQNERVLYQHDEFQHLVDARGVKFKYFIDKDQAKGYDSGSEIWSDVQELANGKIIRYHSRIG